MIPSELTHWPGWVALVAAVTVVLASFVALVGYAIDRIAQEGKKP